MHQILWVDDEPGICLFEIEELRLESELNCQIDLASTVEVALRRLKNKKYSLIIADIRFGQRKSATDLLSELRSGGLGEEAKVIPVILRTFVEYETVKWILEKYDWVSYSGKDELLRDLDDFFMLLKRLLVPE